MRTIVYATVAALFGVASAGSTCPWAEANNKRQLDSHDMSKIMGAKSMMKTLAWTHATGDDLKLMYTSQLVGDTAMLNAKFVLKNGEQFDIQNEIRICMEFAKEGDFATSSRKDRIAFYGNIREKKFSTVRIMKAD